jgi:putative nucleotidyltransferase with HDIG domain
MKQVLFVDEEPRVLEGLKRMLRPLRREWAMEFASSGLDALRRLAESPCDVLVTGVRLPEMDVVALLSQAIRVSPQTVRIILCGPADIDVTLRSVSLAHQYLVKPSDVHTIQATVEKALTLRSILDNPALTSLIGRIKSLPSPPTIYHRLMHAVLSDDTSAAEVGSIIAQDLGMTAKILQLANSPLFAPVRVIGSPEQAVIYLGIETVRALAITESIFCQFGSRNHPGFSPEELRQHSFQVATLARRIAKARHLAPQFLADVYLGGLMHDIGKLVLGSSFPAEYRDVVRCFGDSEALRETEQQLFGATHAEVGAYLLWLWGVPASIAAIVAQHHSADSDLDRATGPAAIVHLADRIVRGGESAPDCEYLAKIGLSPALLQMPEWTAEQLHRPPLNQLLA